MLKKWFPLVILVMVITKKTNAQVPSSGQCPEVKVMEDFKPKEYLGIWYEYAKYPFVFEILGKCIYAEYGMTDDNTITVVNSQINRITGTKSNITGTATVTGPGTLLVKFAGMPDKGGSNYLVLGTDYTSYAVVFSCVDAAQIIHGRLLWILTRERQPSESAVKAAYDIIEKNNLSKSLLLKTDQEECPEK